MKINYSKFASVSALALILAAFSPAHAAIVITEVHPTGSSASYASDWFEVTNTDPVMIVDLTGWTMDDNSNGSAKVALRGVTSIGPGETIVFFEGNTSGSTDLTKTTSFNSAWGTSFVFGVNIGAYGGSGVSLSSGGDAVNVFNASAELQANVVFGAATTGVSFDNAAGLNNASISQLSAEGINGAFSSGGELGSPGVIPEPSSVALVGLGAAAVAFRRSRRR